MQNFKFTAPFLSDKDSKKWMVRYKIEYPNEKPEYRKEFGKNQQQIRTSPDKTAGQTWLLSDLVY